jgi:hypothetical protein
MEERKSGEIEEREPYEAPELVTLASVEDATLSTPETVGSDALLALSSA